MRYQRLIKMKLSSRMKVSILSLNASTKRKNNSEYPQIAKVAIEVRKVWFPQWSPIL